MAMPLGVSPPVVRSPVLPPVVVLDPCVLYPAAQRDLLMWLAAGGVIRAHWTNEIHAEWMRMATPLPKTA